MSSLSVPRGGGEPRSQRVLEAYYNSARRGVLRKTRSDLVARRYFVSEPDLDAAYNAAWVDLLRTIDAGTEIIDPPGWLIRTTFRRAIDSRRSWQLRREVSLGYAQNAYDDDLDDRVDVVDSVRAAAAVVRFKFADRDARIVAMLLNEYSRMEICEELGISEKRLGKILDGHNRRRGLVAQLHDYLHAIAEGNWCESNASLIRAYTVRLLAPGSQKIAEAEEHLRNCSACRSYSRSYGQAKDDLASVLWIPAAAGTGAELEGRTGVLAHLYSAMRSVADSLRSLVGLGGSEGVAAAGGGASLGGGVLAIGGFTAGRIAAGCAAVASVGTCLVVAGGLFPSAPPARDADDERRAAITRDATPQPRAPIDLATAFASTAPPSAVFSPSPAAVSPQQTSRARAELRERDASILSPTGDEFAFEAGATSNGDRTDPGSRPARVTRDMNIENQMARTQRRTSPTPDEDDAAATTAAAPPVPQAPPPPSTDAETTSAPTAPEAAAPEAATQQPQRETFGIER